MFWKKAGTSCFRILDCGHSPCLPPCCLLRLATASLEKDIKLWRPHFHYFCYQIDSNCSLSLYRRIFKGIPFPTWDCLILIKIHLLPTSFSITLGQSFSGTKRHPVKMLLSTATLFVILLLQRAQALCYNDTCLYGVKLAGTKASADCNSFELLAPTVTMYAVYRPTLPPVSLTFVISSTAHIITITVTGIETIWTPSISYSIWQSITATTTSTLHGTESQTPSQKNNSTIITKREVMPRATQIIPTYASSCLNRGQYMSACSCIGIDLPEPTYVRDSII